MGGDDFQKKDSGLGLRDAITNKRQSIDSAASKRAHELFDEMKIIQAVTNSIGQGKREVEIIFPREVLLSSSDPMEAPLGMPPLEI